MTPGRGGAARRDPRGSEPLRPGRAPEASRARRRNLVLARSLPGLPEAVAVPHGDHTPLPTHDIQHPACRRTVAASPFVQFLFVDEARQVEVIGRGRGRAAPPSPPRPGPRQPRRRRWRCPLTISAAIVGVQLADGQVVEEEERVGALHGDVVDAVVDEVDPDAVVALRARSPASAWCRHRRSMPPAPDRDAWSGRSGTGSQSRRPRRSRTAVAVVAAARAIRSTARRASSMSTPAARYRSPIRLSRAPARTCRRPAARRPGSCRRSRRCNAAARRRRPRRAGPSCER